MQGDKSQISGRTNAPERGSKMEASQRRLDLTYITSPKLILAIPQTRCEL